MTARPVEDDRASVFAGLPLWARTAGIVGIPGLIALFLVWVGANSLPRIERAQLVEQKELEQLTSIMQQNAAQSLATFRLMQKICVNTARDEQARNKCFD